jgi:hypothetical protein
MILVANSVGNPERNKSFQSLIFENKISIDHKEVGHENVN